MATEKEMQEKYVLYQYMEQQMKQIHQQLQTIDQQIVELTGVKKALSELKQIPVNTDILVPIASGIFAKAKLMKNEELLVNVGDNVSLTKTFSQTEALLEKQSTELMTFRMSLLEALQKVTSQAQIVEKQLEKMVKEQEEKNV